MALADRHIAAPAADPRFAQPDCLFFGIGAQKAGTTWLHDYLAAHDQVRVPRVKEVHYWDRLRATAETDPRLLTPEAQGAPGPAGGALRAARMSARRLRRRWSGLARRSDPAHSAYADILFAGARTAPAVGEITPAYALLGTETFREMAALACNTRFFFVMRDPVRRLHSGLRHRLLLTRGAGGVDEDAVRQAMAAALANPGSGDIQRSRYDRTIGALEAAVPAGRIAYFFYETMFCQKEVDRLCRFLGVTPAEAEVARRVQPLPRPRDAYERRSTPEGLPEDLDRAAREVLAPVYRFCAERFGNVPAAWAVKGGM